VKKSVLLLVPLALVLGACVTVPSGPSVMVLPGTGKPFEHFQADDAACRQFALQSAGISAKKAAGDSMVSGAAVGTVIGAAAGAALGAAAGNPAIGAAAGAGAGLLGGTAVGGSYADANAHSAQRRYDVGYMQCMYAKGNQIPVSRGSVPYSSTNGFSTAPPPPPPPATTPPAGSAPAMMPPQVPPPPPGPPPPPPPGRTS
jgi:outer membrane lipoprotein SlyB